MVVRHGYVFSSRGVCHILKKYPVAYVPSAAGLARLDVNAPLTTWIESISGIYHHIVQTCIPCLLLPGTGIVIA